MNRLHFAIASLIVIIGMIVCLGNTMHTAYENKVDQVSQVEQFMASK